MKTQKILFLMTTISCLLFSCSTSEDGSSQAGDTSKQEASSSQAQSSEKSSLPTFGDLDHVKVFVSKDTNMVAYNTIYAWDSSDQPIIGSWPGTALATYDNDWLSYDFDAKYTQFSIILNTGANGQQTSHSGMPISGKGAYWYYNDAMEKNDTMPDLHPQNDTSNPDQGGGGGSSTTNAENGNIFHAFDWSLNAIKNNLSGIADAGYTTIQTSPLQRPKEYEQNRTNNDWWRLYQPYSFDVPSSGSWLGSRTDLKNLTSAAHKKNINIIVDIVANHVGGNGDNPDGGVMDEIKNNTSQTLRHEGQCYDWNSRYDVTHKRIGGYPELNSSNTTVQNIVYNYLKNLIDDGVDGFRFDAAKHIETPYDNDNIKSSFWTNTATKAYKYAKDTYDKQLYMYGEILDNCGGVPFDYYTNILDGITDNRTGNSVLSAVQNGNASGAAKSGYDTGMSADKLVVWGESHDTYMNTIEYGGITRNSEQKNVDKAYALMGSRKGARALYFCRPKWEAKIGSGEVQNTNYKNPFITAVNKLKTDMGNNDETVRSEGNIAYVARHGNNGYGAAIVNVTNSSGNTTVTLTNLPNGTYLDLISNKTYTMKNGSITVNLNSSYSATVIEKVS